MSTKGQGGACPDEGHGKPKGEPSYSSCAVTTILIKEKNVSTGLCGLQKVK